MKLNEIDENPNENVTGNYKEKARERYNNITKKLESDMQTLCLKETLNIETIIKRICLLSNEIKKIFTYLTHEKLLNNQFYEQIKEDFNKQDNYLTIIYYECFKKKYECDASAEYLPQRQNATSFLIVKMIKLSNALNELMHNINNKEHEKMLYEIIIDLNRNICLLSKSIQVTNG